MHYPTEMWRRGSAKVAFPLYVAPKMPRVALLTSTLDPRNGWGRYSLGVGQALEGLSEFFQITLDTNSKNNNSWSNFFLTRKLRIILNKLILNLKLLFKTKNFDVIHCLTEECLMQGILLKLVKRKKLFITLHGTYAVINFRNPLNACKLLLALSLSTKITTGSNHTLSRIPKVFHKKVFIIPNGVNLHDFYPPKFPLKAREHFIIVGALKPRKGADLLLEALKLLPENPHLYIVGDQGNDYFFKKLLDFTSKNKLESQVHFHHDLSDAKLRELYSRAYALVLPARIEKDSFEGFPMVIFEANACGTPAICTKGFGADDAIINGVTGYLIEPLNIVQLAESMRKIMNDWDSEEHSFACFNQAEKFAWSQIGPTLLDFYS